MLFHFLNFSQYVVCMFGYKKDLESYKSQSPLQREIFSSKNIYISGTTMNGSFGLRC